MANKHLSRQPRDIKVLHGARDAWCYEESGGIFAVTEHANLSGEYTGTSTTLIPWVTIRAALRRKDKPRAG